MNKEFFEALNALTQEKGISADYMIDKIKNAIISAVKNSYGAKDNIIIEVDFDKKKFEVALRKQVVEAVEDAALEILPQEAAKYNKRAVVGDFVEVPLETKQFGRIAAGTAKNVIRQGIREAERGQAKEAFQSKTQELVSAVVDRIDPINGNVILEIGKNTAAIPKSELIPGEEFTEGQHIKVYIVDVKDSDRPGSFKTTISRTHPGLVKRLFEMNVPEIFDGIVEIKNISREAGSRTKIAVCSKDESVDCIGSCIGPKGSRVNVIVDELHGEKIDIIKYSDDPKEYIAEALSPSKVLDVQIIDENAKSCRAIVPDEQLSLAIGNKGQNARLAAKLTGWKIDIKSKSQEEQIEIQDQQESTDSETKED